MKTFIKSTIFEVILFFIIILISTKNVSAGNQGQFLFIPLLEGTYRSAQSFLSTDYDPELYHLGKDYCVSRAGKNKDGSLFGTPIYPIAKGKIIEKRDIKIKPGQKDDGVGKYIVIDHGNNLVSVYMHLANVLITEGEVDIDTPFAEAGDVDMHPEPKNCPHLHLEIRVNGYSGLNVYPSLRFAYISRDGKTKIEAGHTFPDDFSIYSWISNNFEDPDIILNNRFSDKLHLKNDSMVDYGSCPGEGCILGKWNSQSRIDIYRSPANNSPVLFSLEKGDRINAITSFYQMAPIRASVLQKVLLGEVYAETGDTIYLLTGIGEGFAKLWYKNKFLVADIAGGKGLQMTNGSTWWHEKNWWIKVVNSKGYVGWTNQSGLFKGKSKYD